MEACSEPRNNDPLRTTGVECGALKTVRSSQLAAVFEYEYEHCAVRALAERQFRLDAIIATAKGQWKFRGSGGWTDIDTESLVLGTAGDAYLCRHDPRKDDRKIAICLRPGAVDEGIKLFDKQIVPARRFVTLLRSVLCAATTDEFDSLVFTVFHEAAIESTGSSCAKPVSIRMERAKRFLEMHACESLQLADLARELGFSPFTTLRQFRDYTGTTPYNYLLRVRLDRAKHLLRTSNAPVEAIAKTVGFRDVAYFSRFFKQRTGISPSLYRAA